jgi:hypothetical protein
MSRVCTHLNEKLGLSVRRFIWQLCINRRLFSVEWNETLVRNGVLETTGKEVAVDYFKVLSRAADKEWVSSYYMQQKSSEVDGSGWVPVAGSCDHSNEPSRSIKGREIY